MGQQRVAGLPTIIPLDDEDVPPKSASHEKSHAFDHIPVRLTRANVPDPVRDGSARQSISLLNSEQGRYPQPRVLLAQKSANSYDFAAGRADAEGSSGRLDNHHAPPLVKSATEEAKMVRESHFDTQQLRQYYEMQPN